ncbi:MAG: type II secretion system protein GspD [Sedimentisphaerales bacterium]|nr:type II secretion system protein GspD [Sedimentisphaerales bacterium]
MNEEKKYKNAAIYTRRVVIWTIITVVVGALAIGEIDDSPKNQFAFAELIPSAVAAEPQVNEEEVVVTPGGQIQSLSFKKDMSIKDALRFLAAKYQKNIVPSANVDGIVTVSSLYDVTFEQALEAILGYGFKYQQDGNFIKVYTADEYQKIKNDPDRMVQRVFTLYYVNSTEMKKLITPVLSASAIVASSTEAGQDTEAGEGGDSLAMHDTIVVYDYPENTKRVASMIEQIDVRPPAILLDVTILEAQLKDETEFGIDFSSIAGAAMSISSNEGFTSSGFASSVTGSKGLTAAFSIDDITGFLRALESITDTTVLANPKIIALNKQAAHILIGAEDGYLTTTQVSDGGVVTQQVEFLESGTTLKFRPYVCSDGYIRMEINPEQSTVGTAAKSGFTLPTKETTKVSTNVMVKDGKTVVIGGLFKDDIRQDHSQVPVLGDLPVIGGVFQQVKDTVTRKELIILITPHIIEDPEELSEFTDAKDIKRVVDGAHESLNIINRTKIFEGRLGIAQQYYTEGYYRAALAELDTILALRPNFPQAERLKAEVLGKIKETQ